MARSEVDLVREAYGVFNAGDRRFLDYLDDDVEWVPAAQVVESGPVRGKAGVEQLLGSFRDAFEEIRWVPVRIERGTEPGQVVVLLDVHTRGRGSGAEVDIRVAHLVLVRRDKIVSGKVYPHAEDAFEAAGISGG